MLEYLKGDFLAGVRKVPGWRRTAIYDVVDSLVTSANHSPKENQAAKYLVVIGESQTCAVVRSRYSSVRLTRSLSQSGTAANTLKPRQQCLRKKSSARVLL